MNELIAIGIYVVSGFMAALSQMILKLAVLFPKKGKWGWSWLDRRIFVAYAMLILTLFLNMIAMRYIPFKYVPVLSSLSYVFVLFLGNFVLHEKIGTRKMVGIAMIFLGMFIFYFD